MKQTYRLTRRYKDWGAGREVELTEDEAIRLDNEAPGVLERIIPEPLVREMSRAHGEGHSVNRPAKPTVKADV